MIYHKDIKQSVLIEQSLKQNPQLAENKTEFAKQLCRNFPDIFKNVELARKNISKVVNKKTMGITRGGEKGQSRVMAFSCLHLPYHHAHAIDFLEKVANQYKPDHIVCLGDLIDNQSVSYHEVNPDLLSPEQELQETKKYVKILYRLFPRMIITMGNHDKRYMRKACSAGLPSGVIKPFIEILETPQWEFKDEVIIETVRYWHADGGGKASVNACATGMSHVQGHLHSELSASYRATDFNSFFAVTAGSLVDHKVLAMRYAKAVRFKPALGCVIIDKGRRVNLIPMFQ